MSVPNLLAWAPRKGIHLLGTGDFTHPGWREEMEEHLEADGSGLLKPKDGGQLRLMLTGEFQTVFSLQDKPAWTHLLVTAPGFDAVDRLRSDLSCLADFTAETVPLFQLPVAELVERILNASSQSFVIPSRIWSSGSAVYGSRQQFQSLADCLGDMASEVTAVETGLSSDPAMCWRIGDLDSKQLLSGSDAHFLRNLGRELTLFEGELSYAGFTQAMRSLAGTRIHGTVEQVSELGRYFFNGHRGCQIAKSPIETHFEGRRCPACRKQLTIGAFQRMLESASRTADDLSILEERGWIRSRKLNRPPFRRTIPLQKIIAATYGVKGRESHTVNDLYERALSGEATELEILLDLSETDLQALLGPQVAEGVLRVREGFFKVSPGYDGVWGQLEIFEEKETAELLQMRLF